MGFHLCPSTFLTGSTTVGQANTLVWIKQQRLQRTTTQCEMNVCLQLRGKIIRKCANTNFKMGWWTLGNIHTWFWASNRGQSKLGGSHKRWHPRHLRHCEEKKKDSCLYKTLHTQCHSDLKFPSILLLIADTISKRVWWWESSERTLLDRTVVPEQW